MNNINAVITGVGGYVPKYLLDNEEMSRIVDTSDEWIMERIGVKSRHILKDEERQGAGVSYLFTKAAEDLLRKHPVDLDSIEAVICATTTPDYHFPSTASLVIGNLGLKNAFGFDMEAACAGFLYAMEVGSGLIRSGQHKRILVCGGDFVSSMTNYQDRTTCPIFGDGAGCVLMEATTEPYGFLDSYLRTDSHYDPLHMEAGGSANVPSHETVDKRLHFIYQEGRQVFKAAVTNMSDAVEIIAKRNNLTVDNIAWIVPHQANVRIELAVARRINVPAEKVMMNIDHMANTSGGTLPLCLWEYEPKLRKGDNIIFTAFGAGFTWGAAYMRWGYDGE